MGQFLNPARALPVAGASALRPPATTPPPSPLLANAKPAITKPVNAKPQWQPAAPLEVPNLRHTIGIVALCLSILAPFVNDWLMHLFSATASLYYIGFPLSILAWVLCGTTFRAWRTTAGKLWTFLMVWLILSVPLSVWPGGSADILKAYIPRAHIMFFMICAFALTLRQCRTLMYAYVIGGLIFLLSSIVFGAIPAQTGRFCIPGSLYFENPNDFALQLVAFIGIFAFLLLNKNWALRALGGVAMVLTLWFLLRAASRGAFVACVVLFITAFIFTKAKLKLTLILVAVAVLIPTVSKDALHRLALIVSNPESESAHNENEEATIASQFERQHLFWLSITVTLRHPLLGVGPGMFIEATSGADQKHGKHSPALGTHNSYTQVSSEAGIPALISFLGVAIISVRKMLKLHRQTTGIPELSDFAALSYSLFLSCLGFAVAAFFYHVAYSGYMALLGGMAMAVWMASQPVLNKYNLRVSAVPAVEKQGAKRNGSGIPNVLTAR